MKIKIQKLKNADEQIFEQNIITTKNIITKKYIHN